MDIAQERLRIEELTPSYWRVIVDNPPVNLYDPEMFAELRVLVARMEIGPLLKVIVFDGAEPDYFVAHFDILRGREIPAMEGAAPFDQGPIW